MPRIVILGCGTGVGKTRVSAALLRELTRRRQPCVGLKPIESGVGSNELGTPPLGSDAALLSEAGSLRAHHAHPLYAFREPISPHLAARRAGTLIEVDRVCDWLSRIELSMTPGVSSDSVTWRVIETAGGVFSPLGPGLTNFDLARALEPAVWVLVAADALGVLHDVSATREAMMARGRSPDHLVLSQAREPDASTGSNATELNALGIATPSALLARHDDRGIGALVDRLLTLDPNHATYG
ncbi:MAG: dethiobiotin synthase [Polyangiaceae bacterium]